MTQSTVFNKWATIMESIGATGSKADWMSKYIENSSISEDIRNTNTTHPQLLPIAMKVAAQTIGLNLVAVKPLGGGNNSEELKGIRQDVVIENRDRKINAITEGDEFNEMKVEDHPDYIKPKGPLGELLYMDFVYGSTQSKI